jgi:hypothetical protein
VGLGVRAGWGFSSSNRIREFLVNSIIMPLN